MFYCITNILFICPVVRNDIFMNMRVRRPRVVMTILGTFSLEIITSHYFGFLNKAAYIMYKNKYYT